MIARLRGIVDSHTDNGVVIDVGGVGYLVFCSGRTLAQLPAPGGSVSLHVETHVREDHIHLYGFQHEAERQCFRLLQTVQGVGSRAALALLSGLNTDEVIGAIAAGDSKSLTRAEGIGPRIAGRIVNELAGRVSAFGVTGAAELPAGGIAEEAISALVNLGWSRSQAHGAVAAAARAGPDLPLEGLITASLKELSP